MTKKKSLVFWLIGLAILSIFLYLIILRHPGYIYFWDMSGSFGFTAPFDQYFFLYTPWDGLNVGVKNRLPLVTLIFLVSKPLQLIFSLPDQVVIKIAVFLMFLGAYSAFYMLFPRWPKLINKEIKKETLKSTKFQVFRLVFSLLYVFIPIHTYRTSQMHLFFLSTFYPIHTYLFLRLLEADKVDFKGISLFVISMFFGLTTPHIIVMEVLTFIPLFIVRVFSDIKKIGFVAINLAVAGIGVIVTNLYWLVPYFAIGQPDPGYVLSNQLIESINQHSGIIDFLVGQSEWYLDQGKFRVLDNGNATLFAAQIIGVLVLYFFAVYFLFKKLKARYAIGLGLVLATILIIVVQNIPYHDVIFNTLVFSRFGWAFRESNKFSMAWSFWVFLLFSLGMTFLICESKLRTYVDKIFYFGVIPGLLIPFLLYLTPINVKFMKYLKPVEIPEEVNEIFDYFEEDEDFFYVYYFPENEPFISSWREKRANIMDAIEYEFLPYNSPKPSVYVSSVVPHSKRQSSFMTEYLFQSREKMDDISEYLNYNGVKYIAVDRKAHPLNFTEDQWHEILLDPMLDYLDDSDEFELAWRNDIYSVYENESFDTGMRVYEQDLYVADGYSVMEHIDPEQLADTELVFCEFPENNKRCSELENEVILTSAGNENFFLELMTIEDREKYGVFPYDYIRDYGVDYDWARGSILDRMSGPMHAIFRNYEIEAWNFDVIDKFVYSDKPFHEDKTSEVSFEEDLACTQDCDIYAYVLYNHIGGELEIEIDSNSYGVNTDSEIEAYRWVKLDEGVDFSGGQVEFVLKNRDGFSSLGSILIVSQEVPRDLENRAQRDNTVVEIGYGGFTDIPHYEEPACSIDSVEYSRGLVSILDISSDCRISSEAKIKAYDSNYITHDLTDGQVDYLDYSRLGTGEQDTRIYMLSDFDLTVWFLFFINLFILAIPAVVIFKKR